MKKILKLTTLFSILFLTGFSTAAFGQQITLKENQAPMETVLNAIKQQSGYQLFYDHDDIVKAGKVTVSLQNVTLEQALDAVTKDQPLSYKIFDKTIAIRKKEETFTAPVVNQARETYSINGRVTDAKGETLPGATVFLTNSKIVTIVNGDGVFSLNVLQPGTYELVVKMLGYNSYNQNVTIQKQSISITIKLSENTTALNEVVINAKTDPNRARYLRLFTENFIGKSANAAQCKILNPDVIKLHYDKDKDILEAHSDDFIVIENLALGYKINYLLSHFKFDTNTGAYSYEGNPYFEDLKGNDTQQKKWADNRKIAYEGSIRHFFKALFNNTAEAEGFLVYRLPVKLMEAGSAAIINMGKSPGYMAVAKSTQVLGGKPINSTSLFSFIDNDFRLLKLNTVHEPGDSTNLFVVYTREQEPNAFYNSEGHIDIPVKSSKKSQVSQIIPIKDGIVLDKNGSRATNDIVFNGYWTWERIADLMPFEYSTAAPKPVSGKLIELTAALDSFRNKAPIEKVHIHFDKPYYSLGDTVWMKAYVVNENNELSTSGKFLYADLVNDKDSLKTSLRLPLTSGLGWGSITLSDSLLKAGNYHIRAYTNLMRNFGEEYYFDKAIKIGNALPPVKGTGKPPVTKVKKEEQVVPVKNDAANIDIQFFPEGGEMVNGLISKVAFKAVGDDGLGKEIAGYVVDQNNQQVAIFQSEHAGMGTFTIQPVAGNTFTVVLKLPDGEKRVELPKAKDQGYGLSVIQTESNVIVSIQVSGALLNKGEITLVAQANNTVQYTGKATLTRNGFTTVIPKSRFSEGILQFTLFSPDYKPVAERLVFIRNADKHLNVTLTPDKKVYKQRNRVYLNLEVTNQDGKPVSGAFSLAVTDEEKVPYGEADEKTIFSSLLLTSDLKGYVEHPNYYFTDINPDKDKQLDNLLLTQGWRRFVWSDLLTNTFPAITYQAEKGRGVSGRVVTDKGKPVPDAKVTLLVNAGGGVILDTTVNTDGRFNFDFPFSQGTTYNVTATDVKKSAGLKIEIDKQQTGPQTNFKHLPDEQPEKDDFTTYLNNSKNRFNEMKKYGLLGGGILLKEVKINEYQKAIDIKAIAVQHSQNLAGAGNADQVITFVDLLSANSVRLGLWLDGRVPGVLIRNPKNLGWAPYNLAAYGADPKNGNRPPPMTLIIDGIEVDSTMYSYLNVEDISSIEILKGASAALYGMHGAAGVFIVTTKKGDVDYNAYAIDRQHPNYSKPAGLKTYTFQGGYDFRREFYSPNYDNPKTDTQMADLRSTIYWNPNIITDENGKATVKFFNADGTGNYKVIAEGLDRQGNLGRQLYRYIVK